VGRLIELDKNEHDAKGEIKDALQEVKNN